MAHPAIVATRAALGVKNGEPVGVSDVFPPDAGTLYAWFRIAGHKQPTKLRGEWHYLGGGGDRMVIASDLTIQPNESWGDFQFELPPGRPWPLGAYRVDILMDGKVAASVPFRIEQAAAKPAPQAQAAPKIVEAKPARGVKDGKPVDPGDVFAPDTNPIYVWYRLSGNAKSVEIRSVWHYLGGGEASEAEGGTHPAGREWGYLGKELPPGRPWPLGEYRVDILIDGAKAASVPFRVAAAAPKVTISQAQVARGVKDGQPVDTGTVFAPNASPLYVWFRVAGNAGPVKLRGEWHYLGGGGDQVIAKAEGELKPGTTTANFRRTLPEGKTWPLGDYRMDVFAGDALAASVRFRIEEGKPAAAAAPAGGAITLASVEALLRELGADPQANTRKDGVPYFEFALDGRKTALALYGCTPGPCAQALLHTGFRIGKKPDLQAINDWNREQRFVRAYLDRDGDPTVESDLVVAGAETAALREWIATWRRQVPQFLAHVTK